MVETSPTKIPLTPSFPSLRVGMHRSLIVLNKHNKYDKFSMHSHAGAWEREGFFFLCPQNGNVGKKNCQPYDQYKAVKRSLKEKIPYDFKKQTKYHRCSRTCQS